MAGPSSDPRPDGTGEIIIEVHLLDADTGTAVAWNLHATQPVRLGDGQWTFGSTWEVGDLIYPPTFATAIALRDSLQPAVNEFCDVYLAARALRQKAREQNPSPAGAAR